MGNFLTLIPFQTFSISALPNEIIILFLLVTLTISIINENKATQLPRLCSMAL